MCGTSLYYKIFVVYLQFKFNWVSCILSGNPTESKCSVNLCGSKGVAKEGRKEERQGRKEPVHPLMALT